MPKKINVLPDIEPKDEWEEFLKSSGLSLVSGGNGIYAQIPRFRHYVRTDIKIDAEPQADAQTPVTVVDLVYSLGVVVPAEAWLQIVRDAKYTAPGVCPRCFGRGVKYGASAKGCQSYLCTECASRFF